MYSLSQTAKNLFQSVPWGITLTFYPIVGEDFTVTRRDIVQGSFTVDRYSATGEALPVGTATAGEISFALENFDGRFSEVVFGGAEIYAVFTVTDGTNTYTLPIGYFTVDETPRVLSTIQITALDRMAQFDKSLEGSSVVYPCTVRSMVIWLCQHAGVTSPISDLNSLPNDSYTIPHAPDTQGDVTARQMLQWCCQILGCNAQVGRNGAMRLLAYSTDGTPPEIDDTVRFSSDLLDEVTITGTVVTDTNGETASDSIGSYDREYTLEIKDNPLIQHNPETVLAGLNLTGLVFSPFTAEVIPMPWMDISDALIFAKDGEYRQVFITKLTQTAGANTKLEGAGKSATKQGYAALDPLTAREQQILRDIRTRTTEQVTAAEQNAIEFSQIIGNSLGLYTNSVTSGGSTTYYFSNEETLADSSVIYTFNANGFAWTNDWNNGNPVWKGGVAQMDAASSAIFTFLQANKITADYIEGGTITAKLLNISAGDSLFDGSTVGEVIDAQTASTRKGVEDNTEELERQTKYIRIGDLPDGTTGVGIGRIVNDEFTMLASFTENKLTFFDDNQSPVAWISDAELRITKARIQKTLNIGGYEFDANYDDANNPGRLTIRWVGVK